MDPCVEQANNFFANKGLFNIYYILHILLYSPFHNSLPLLIVDVRFDNGREL